MHKWPVAYQYKVEILCPDCTLTVLGLPLHDTTAGVEQVLDAAAQSWDVRRHDERSFDSGEFPKVVLDPGCESCHLDMEHEECVPERCDACREELD